MIDGQMRAHLPTSFDATALFLKVEEMISLNHTRIQETLIVTLVWAFDLTRTLESELLDNGTIHLSRSLSHRLCDMITRQMCKPSAYLRGVLSNEVGFLHYESLSQRFANVSSLTQPAASRLGSIEFHFGVQTFEQIYTFNQSNNHCRPQYEHQRSHHTSRASRHGG